MFGLNYWNESWFETQFDITYILSTTDLNIMTHFYRSYSRQNFYWGCPGFQRICCNVTIQQYWIKIKHKYISIQAYLRVSIFFNSLLLFAWPVVSLVWLSYSGKKWKMKLYLPQPWKVVQCMWKILERNLFSSRERQSKLRKLETAVCLVKCLA